MYCTQCGAPNADTAKFCAKCGASLGAGGGATVWRDGDRLVVAKGGSLPSACVKCGRPATGEPLKKSFYWHSPWLYLLILVNLIVYAIVAMIVRKRFDLLVPMCEEHRRRRRTMLWIGIPLLFAIIVFPIVGGAVAGDDGVGFGVLLGLGALIAGIVVLVVGARVLRATRIDDQQATFKGAREEFLQQLPAASTTLYR